MPGVDQNDPNALYEYTTAGIAPQYGANLQNLGYVPRPFATQEQIFQDQYKFQQVLKNILDTQMGQGNGGYNAFGGNTAMLPFNLRNIFAAAGNVFGDPTYGRPGFADALQHAGGWFSGNLPQNRQPAYENWWNTVHNYPNVAAPNPTAANTVQGNGGGGGGGGGGGTPGGTQQYTVGLEGGGSMTVNANDPESARKNAEQGGNRPTDRVESGGYKF